VIFIDTNTYSAFKKGEEEAVNVILTADIIVLSPIVYGELIAGFRIGSMEEKNRNELEKFIADPKVVLAKINELTSETYAKIFQELKGKGKPIPTNDIWIAANCIQMNSSLFTYDKHFLNIDNLKIVQTSSDLL